MFQTVVYFEKLYLTCKEKNNISFFYREELVESIKLELSGKFEREKESEMMDMNEEIDALKEKHRNETEKLNVSLCTAFP